jgi:hypothetical protein
MTIAAALRVRGDKLRVRLPLLALSVVALLCNYKSAIGTQRTLV